MPLYIKTNHTNIQFRSLLATHNIIMAKLASNIGVMILITISCLLESTLNVYASKQGSVAGDFPRDLCLCKEKVVKFHVFVHDLSVNYPNTTTRKC